ncbi:MAG: hypothetical protein P4L56_10980 [Candidatus Sulfopaludibacter sp.]|nr:hypothetical protein [Candidatus Sulfopaludibacter sp.]
MDLVIAISIVTGAALMLAAVLLIRRVAVPGGSLPVTAEWIDELSIERYRPMMRLLDGGDLEFLRTQPGFTSKMVTRLRVQRCQIFRGYLRSLSCDFGRVCAAIKLVMLQSRHDRPDLAGALMRHQALFIAGVMNVHFQLFLYRWGLCAVDVTNLVKIFDMMRLELRTLVPAAVPMGA